MVHVCARTIHFICFTLIKGVVMVSFLNVVTYWKNKELVSTVLWSSSYLVFVNVWKLNVWQQSTPFVRSQHPELTSLPVKQRQHLKSNSKISVVKLNVMLLNVKFDFWNLTVLLQKTDYKCFHEIKLVSAFESQKDWKGYSLLTVTDSWNGRWRVCCQ